MAFTATAALISGSAAVTAGTVLAAVAEVGMALSVVGGITGNKTLSKIGGVMSLVGGVGGMLAGGLGSGGASAASSLADAGADAATSAAWSEGAAGLGQDTMANMGLDSAASSANSGIVSGAQSGLPDLGGTIAANPADLALKAGTKATPGQMTVGADAGTQAAATVNDVAGAQMPVGVKGPAGAQGPSTPFDSTSTSLNAPQSSTSFFDKFSKFAEGNKTLFNSGMQLVGGALKGANESKMWDEKMALEKDRLRQTSYGNTTASFKPRTGIIAGAQTQ
jgi:hypothetical protein